MARLLVSVFMSLTLLFGSSMLGASAAVSETSQISIDHKPGHHPKGKAKAKGHAHNKHRNYTIAPQPVLSPKDDNGKHKGKCKGKKKKKCNRNEPGQPIFGPPAPSNRPDNRGPTTGQQPDRCVIIERPTETRVEYRTKTETKTHRILYGAGLFALAMVGAGLLALFLGYVLGWRASDKNDEKFYNGLLRKRE